MTDATQALLTEIVAQAGGRISAINLPHNVGKAGAVQRGILAAFEKEPELAGYWDADLSTPLAAVPDFIDVLDANPQLELVMGARVKLLGRHIYRHASRHYFGRVFATAASVALRLPVYDTQCGAKVFRANPTFRHVFSTPFRSRWVFDVEILARYIAESEKGMAESRIYELPLKTWTDVPGSKVTIWQAILAIWDLTLIALRDVSPRR